MRGSVAFLQAVGLFGEHADDGHRHGRRSVEGPVAYFDDCRGPALGLLHVVRVLDADAALEADNLEAHVVAGPHDGTRGHGMLKSTLSSVVDAT